MDYILLIQGDDAIARRIRKWLSRRYTLSFIKSSVLSLSQAERADLYQAMAKRLNGVTGTGVALYLANNPSRARRLWSLGAACPETIACDAGRPLMPVKESRIIDIAQAARAAGMTHDIGKASNLFQNKLFHDSIEQDPVRHEWLSVVALQYARRLLKEGRTLNLTAVFDVRLQDFQMPIRPDFDHISDVVDFVVATHHKLLATQSFRSHSRLSNKAHYRGDQAMNAGVLQRDLMPAKDEAAICQIIRKAISIESRLAPVKNDLCYRGMALLARAAVIMADHAISSRLHDAPSFDEVDARLFANTRQGRLNQPLAMHLSQVGEQARHYCESMLTMRLPGLSRSGYNSIMQRSGPGRYQWQDEAVDALTSLRVEGVTPCLVLNTAGTGSGKTRMNAKAACALSHDKARIRFSCNLGLRSLTLQTGDAMREDFGIAARELATIIGDDTIRKLHDKEKEQHNDNDVGIDFDLEMAVAGGEKYTLPNWLNAFSRHKRHFNAVVGAPVLVSTIDFMIAANEPGKQGRHVSALLRLMDSDLVIDEVDAYDPRAMVAVLRLVQMCAILGRNVICSTATLPMVLAKEIAQSYISGSQIRAAMNETAPEHAIAIIDNFLPPNVMVKPCQDTFIQHYQSRINQCLGVPVPKEKLGYRVLIDDTNQWKPALVDTAKKLHRDHHDEIMKKRVSFGLVRVANVNEAVMTAYALCEAMPEAHVCCYHSQDFLIRRHLKERVLDNVLNRKIRKHPVYRDKILGNKVKRSPHRDVTFIVVATPVEEVGRDHDFDWAIVEPSSVRSIIQTIGRVNRHRRKPVDRPNIGLLQFNHRALRDPGKPCFIYPGFEDDVGHASHDLVDLFNFADPDYLSANLLFEDHLFSLEDNAAIARQLRNAKGLFYPDSDKFKATYMGQSVYQEYALREENLSLSVISDPRKGDSVDVILNEGTQDEAWVSKWIDRRQTPPNAWLCFSEQDCLQFCLDNDIEPNLGLRAQVGIYKEVDVDLEGVSLSDFGFFRKADRYLAGTPYCHPLHAVA